MGFLLSLLGGLPGILGQYFTTKAQIQLAQIQTDAQMATSQIAMTSSKFKQWMIIILFTPFLMSLLSHTATLSIFNNISILPQWYLEECVVVFNTILGINVGLGFVGSMVNHIAVFLTHKNDLQNKKP